MKALVLGAGGQLGFALVHRLVASGWSAVAATSRPLVFEGVEVVDGGKSLGAILNDTSPVDAVFHPKAYTVEDAGELIAARHRFGTAIVLSSVSVYAGLDGSSLDEGNPNYGGPLTETTPTLAPGPATYSTRKVAMESALLDSGLLVSILRPGAIYGQHATHPREWWLLKRALDGRTRIPVAYGGRSVFHASSAAGIASLAEFCMRTPATRVLNVADRQSHSIIEIARLLEAATGLRIPLTPIEGPPIGGVGDTPWTTEHPFVIDCQAARDLGWDGGPAYAEAIRPYCKWIVENASDWRDTFTAFKSYANDPFDYAAEDRFFNALRSPPGYGP